MTQWTHIQPRQQDAQRLLTMHATTCASDCNWSVWERVCTKLRSRLANEHAETLAFIIQNYSDHNTLPSTGKAWEVSNRTLKEVAVENEQRDVEGGISEPLMHA
jgi:hypothetical protein